MKDLEQKLDEIHTRIMGYNTIFYKGIFFVVGDEIPVNEISKYLTKENVAIVYKRTWLKVEELAEREAQLKEK